MSSVSLSVCVCMWVCMWVSACVRGEHPVLQIPPITAPAISQTCLIHPLSAISSPHHLDVFCGRRQGLVWSVSVCVCVCLRQQGLVWSVSVLRFSLRRSWYMLNCWSLMPLNRMKRHFCFLVCILESWLQTKNNPPFALGMVPSVTGLSESIRRQSCTSIFNGKTICTHSALISPLPTSFFSLAPSLCLQLSQWLADPFLLV